MNLNQQPQIIAGKRELESHAYLLHGGLLLQREIADTIVDELVEIKLVLREKLQRACLARKAFVEVHELFGKDVEVVGLRSVLSITELECRQPKLAH